MANNAGSSRTDTAVKLVLIFFISLLSFSIGTFVGKNVSDSDHRQAMLTEEYRAPASDSHGTQKADSISEEEVTSLTEEFLKDEVKKEEAKEAKDDGYALYGGKKEQTKEEVHKVESKKPETVAKAAERVAHGKAPMKDATKRKVASILPTVASTAIGKFTVQVASYATEPEAKEHAARLSGKGFSAFYVPASIKNKTWFRVSVGLFNNQKSAVEFQKNLHAQAGITSSIIQKIVK